MSATGGVLLGIDVGGTKIAGVAVDEASGALLAEHRRPLDGTPLERQVIDLARTLLSACGHERPLAIGLAVPGLVDSDAGVMRLAVNVGLDELAIGPLVSDALGAPCHVEHDVRAAALWLLDRGAPRDSLAYLSVGTGISAGVVVDGRLARGINGLAGEIGHTRAVDDGPACTCGLTGCLEVVAAGPAVARLVDEALARGEASVLADGPSGPEALYRAAADGDPLALDIAAAVGGHLARAIRTLVLLYGVDRVVVGGGLSRAGDPFLRPILDELERERAASPLMSHALGASPVELLPPDADPGAWGAVVVARSRIGGASPAREREVADG